MRVDGRALFEQSDYRVALTLSQPDLGFVRAGYDIYRNNSLLTTVGNQTTYVDLAVTAGITYTYAVRARDAAGNVSGPSNSSTVTVPNAPALVFSDDFETGDLSKWASVTGLTVQNQEVFAGGYAARGAAAASATWAWRSLTTPQTELYYRLRFKLVSNGPKSVYAMKVRTATGGSILGVYVANNVRLAIRNDVISASTSSSTSVTWGTWHDLQVRVRINGTSGESEVWYDGARIDALSRTFNLGTTPIGRIQLGDNASGTHDIVFDNVEVGTQFIQ